MEELPKRTIKIGRASVGLVGLEQAMAGALAKDLDDEEAVELIFSAVAGQNYIPAAARTLYRQALGEEYQRLRRGEESGRPGEIKIEILGPGCVSCNRLNDMVFNILQELGLRADIGHINELDEIWRRGVITTPALIINGSVKCAGRLPASSEVKQWLTEEIDP